MNDVRKRPLHMRNDSQLTEPENSKDGICLAPKVFVGAFLALLLSPFVLMPFFSGDASSEKRDLAPEPQLLVDGSFNVNVLSDAGNYFADHFAFRSQLVDVNATIRQKLFATSSTENVVVGSNGWLYYGGTLNDYQRKNSMSDHMLKNAAANLALMQEYFERTGKRFVVAIAPNKNELYPQHMPYYELKGDGESNAERLMRVLGEHGVNYVNLHELFRSVDETLYFERDSHWTDKGALLAYGSIMDALGRTGKSFDEQLTHVDEHLGDVDAMLHPVFAQKEDQKRLDDIESFEFTSDAKNVEDNYLITQSLDRDAQNTLIMYRDSFGNNLLLPFASTYAQAVFTKLVPYDMGTRMTAFAQDVVVERTERHLAFFATNPPYLLSPEVEVHVDRNDEEGKTSLYVSQNGPYVVIEGSLDSNAVQMDDRIFVQVACGDGEFRTYEAFHLSEDELAPSDFEGEAEATNPHITGDWGYRAFISPETLGDPDSLVVRVLAGSAESACVLCVSNDASIS